MKDLDITKNVSCILDVGACVIKLPPGGGLATL